METIDIIKQLCKDKKISVTQLESELGYGNGSLGKSKNMSADRIYQIAQFFGVSMEYLMTGKTLNETDDEMALLRQQQSILMEINKISQNMTEYYKEIAKCQDKLTSLKRDYSKLESKKKIQQSPSDSHEDEKEVDESDPFAFTFNLEDTIPFQ